MRASVPLLKDSVTAFPGNGEVVVNIEVSHAHASSRMLQRFQLNSGLRLGLVKRVLTIKFVRMSHNLSCLIAHRFEQVLRRLFDQMLIQVV